MREGRLTENCVDVSRALIESREAELTFRHLGSVVGSSLGKWWWFEVEASGS